VPTEELDVVVDRLVAGWLAARSRMRTSASSATG
jgi:hypothetical protein